MDMAWHYNILQEIHDSRVARQQVAAHSFTPAEFKSFMNPNAPGYWDKANQSQITTNELACMAKIAGPYIDID